MDLPPPNYDDDVSYHMFQCNLEEKKKSLNKARKVLKEAQKRLKQAKRDVCKAQGDLRRIKHALSVIDRDATPLLEDFRLPLI